MILGMNVDGYDCTRFCKSRGKRLVDPLSVCLSVYLILCIFSFGRGSEEAIGNLASDRV